MPAASHIVLYVQILPANVSGFLDNPPEAAGGIWLQRASVCSLTTRSGMNPRCEHMPKVQTLCTPSSSHSSWFLAANIKKFGFLLHFRYPDHVKTWPVLTAHLASNYTPLPLLPQQPWIKDGQTLMSATLLDRAHDVPTEFKHSCLWPEYTVA